MLIRRTNKTAWQGVVARENLSASFATASKTNVDAVNKTRIKNSHSNKQSVNFAFKEMKITHRALTAYPKFSSTTHKIKHWKQQIL